ncbi:MAG: DeoR/GlpR family DNA-binding transcription regulator [Chloroflexia bacterium]
MTTIAALRREQLVEELLRQGGASVADLSARLRVSEATIRRDLDTLERAGRLRRAHGGALAPAGGGEQSVREREALFGEEKRRIGAAAAALIVDGDTIAMTGGTTTLQVARSIPQGSNCTVVTNAVDIVLELARRPGLTVIATGGRLRPNTLELVGPLAEQTLGQLFVDKAFIGVNGLTLEAGLTTHDETEAVISRIMIRAAREVIVVADRSKLSRVALARMGDLAQVRTLITDKGADQDILAALERAGIDVVAV